MKRTLTALATTGLMFTLAACGQASSPAPAGSGAPSSPVASETTGGDHSMHSADGASTSEAATPAGTPAAGPHNSADTMFAQMMIPHHQGALEMSDPEVTTTAGPAVKKLAAQISAAQTPEIEQMTGWLQGWGEPVEAPHDVHSMPGMLMNAKTHDQVMQELSDLSGPQFDKAWLTAMISHHQGAVDMAQTELKNGSNPEAKKLATSIITSQKAEIAQMKKMLG